jgi:hypothetical protein
LIALVRLEIQHLPIHSRSGDGQAQCPNIVASDIHRSVQPATQVQEYPCQLTIAGRTGNRCGTATVHRVAGIAQLLDIYLARETTQTCHQGRRRSVVVASPWTPEPSITELFGNAGIKIWARREKTTACSHPGPRLSIKRLEHEQPSAFNFLPFDQYKLAGSPLSSGMWPLRDGNGQTPWLLSWKDERNSKLI